MTDAAREMAKPIRERHFRMSDRRNFGAPKCDYCRKPWPCPDALDVYSSEEL